MSQDKKILENRNEVAPEKKLGGTEVAKINGVQVSTTILNFCDVCGHKLGDDFVICKSEGHKVCPSCALRHDQKKICIDCMKKSHPLTKQQYKVLISLYAGAQNYRIIHEITRIPGTTVKEICAWLRNSGYVSKRLLLGWGITDMGEDIMTSYSQVYDSEYDVASIKGVFEIGLQ